MFQSTADAGAGAMRSPSDATTTGSTATTTAPIVAITTPAVRRTSAPPNKPPKPKMPASNNNKPPTRRAGESRSTISTPAKITAAKKYPHLNAVAAIAGGSENPFGDAKPYAFSMTSAIAPTVVDAMIATASARSANRLRAGTSAVPIRNAEYPQISPKSAKSAGSGGVASNRTGQRKLMAGPTKSIAAAPAAASSDGRRRAGS